MKFQLVSDIHLEKYDKLPNIHKFIEPNAPNLILAGDICFAKHEHFVPFFKKLSPLFSRIFFVLGNHEYFDARFHLNSLEEVELIIKDKLQDIKNITILQKNYVELESDIVIMGTTLWSYLSRKDMISPIKLLSETQFILYNRKLMLCPKITNAIHLKQKIWINDMLDKFADKKIIVVTHYLPSKICIGDKFKFCTNNKLYYSNCDELVKKATVWCAGHIHTAKVKMIDNTPIFINPCGYLWETNNYKKDMVFEI